MRDIVVETFRPKEYYNEPFSETNSVQPALVLAKMKSIAPNTQTLERSLLIVECTSGECMRKKNRVSFHSEARW